MWSFGANSPARISESWCFNDGSRLKFVPEAESFGIKLIRHDFDLKFDIQDKKATLVDKLKLSASGSAGSFQFRMSLICGLVDHKSGQASTVFWGPCRREDATMKPLGEATYTINYAAVVDLPNYAGKYQQQEATLTNDYWYPMVGRQPVPYDITIHGPADWLSVGQGDLIEDTVVGSERRTRFLNGPTVRVLQQRLLRTIQKSSLR